MTLAFHDVYGVPDAFTTVAMAGRTDTSLVSEALRQHGIPDTRRRARQVQDRRISRSCRRRSTSPESAARASCPARASCWWRSSGHPHLHVALLTGNYRDAAVIKLTYFDLWNHFAWGAFSDDAGDRNALVPIARERAKSFGVPDAARERAIVIGDTPDDVNCARAAGALLDCRRHRRVQRRGAARGRRRRRARRSVGHRARADPADMIPGGSERGPVALPVFKIGRCLLAGQAGFDSQALPPSATLARWQLQRLPAESSAQLRVQPDASLSSG